MGRIPDQFIDDLLARTDIVEVIESRVPLKRAGREFQARCPFHDERSPSFTVSPTKQFYHCFGCGAHGTAISFLMNYDRLEFLDAIEDLARRVGMEVPRDTRARNEDDQTRELYDVLDRAAGFFRQQLRGSQRARDYLRQRGLDESMVERYAIGYAPDGWEGLKSALGTDGQAIHRLDAAGLLSKNDGGRVYDKFRDRLMFPIHDRRGRVIAFGGRVIDNDDSPKYLNSPETRLFHKGRELYGLWQVKQAHAKIPRLIVVEGYMDVVALAQFGVDTAVATLGTATTPDHAELLFRNAADVYFCFDGDKAGRKAAWRAVESVMPRMRDGRQAFFLFLPEGDDPDTLVRREGEAGFDQRLQAAMPLSQFFFEQMADGIRLDTLDGRARLAERCKPMLAQIPDGAFRDLMQQRLGELSGVSANVASAAAAPKPSRSAPSNPRRGAAPKRSLVRSVVALLLQQPSLAADLSEPHGFASLQLPGVPLLMEMLELLAARPGLTTGAVLEHFAARDEGSALNKLAVLNLPGDVDMWREELADAIRQLEQQTVAQRLDELRAAQAAGQLDEAMKAELRDLLARRAG
ncbi:MAG: DNA primase [Rhodanobacteraceae bacterium]|nr:DNA primase [Xanthomonadales bacterium]MCP5477413.1 DNA primase [Rhodanobacteraceae bacterium]HPF73287.1 DNA primase [Xanthomonadaceae bacterium]HRX99244.1 DNA primase [Xanthomonadaceae bacterium]